MEDLKKILEANAIEYHRNALEAEKRKDYNTSCTLFFKALSALADLYILTKTGIFPTSHSERFRMLREKYPNIYFILDKDFPFYQDSYRAKLNKETSEVLRKDVEELFRLLELRI